MRGVNENEADSFVRLTFGGINDNVSMLTHIYPHKPLRKIEVTRLTAQCTCGLMSDLEIDKPRKEYGQTWHWMSLLRPGGIKQHRTRNFFVRHVVYLMKSWRYVRLTIRNVCVKIYVPWLMRVWSGDFLCGITLSRDARSAMPCYCYSLTGWDRCM